MEDDGKRDIKKISQLKNEAFNYAGIKILDVRYGQDNSRCLLNKEDNSISQSIFGFKRLNAEVAETMLNIFNDGYRDFFDIYQQMKLRKLNKLQIESLIKVGYFNDIISKPVAYKFCQHYEKQDKKANIFNIDKKQIKKDIIEDIAYALGLGLMDTVNLLATNCKKESDKQYVFEDGEFARLFLNNISKNTRLDKLQEIYMEIEISGTTTLDIEEMLIGVLDDFDSSKNGCKFRDILSNETTYFRVQGQSVAKGDIVFIEKYYESKTKNGYIYKVITNLKNLSNIYK